MTAATDDYTGQIRLVNLDYPELDMFSHRFEYSRGGRRLRWCAIKHGLRWYLVALWVAFLSGILIGCNSTAVRHGSESRSGRLDQTLAAAATVAHTYKELGLAPEDTLIVLDSNLEGELISASVYQNASEVFAEFMVPVNATSNHERTTLSADEAVSLIADIVNNAHQQGVNKIAVLYPEHHKIRNLLEDRYTDPTSNVLLFSY